jgi:hypothetical protein
LEEALTKNVTDLLLELGTGFAFLGRQKELVVGGRSRKIDLLFYHIRLRCYIVCELKAKPFEPEFAGKLNYYVNAVDELLKTDDENPTIGLLVCSDMDKIDVQWSLKVSVLRWVWLHITTSELRMPCQAKSNWLSACDSCKRSCRKQNA